MSQLLHPLYAAAGRGDSKEATVTRNECVCVPGKLASQERSLGHLPAGAWPLPSAAPEALGPEPPRVTFLGESSWVSRGAQGGEEDAG